MRLFIGTFLSACCLLPLVSQAQEESRQLSYHVEASATAGGGDYAPLWFTANRNGLSSIHPNSGYLRAGLSFNQPLKHHWNIRAGLDLAGAINQTAPFVIQQAYADISWRFLNLSLGSKERNPLGKNPLLSSGGMVEGNNTRPVPQVRIEMADYVNVPLTKGWLGVKGHVAYGWFTDDNWQRDFAGPKMKYVTNVLYHSKLLMFKVGNEQQFPLSFELGMLMTAQFGGDRYEYDAFRNPTLIASQPAGIKEYFKIFIPGKGDKTTLWGDQVNILGNHLGSWNGALNYRVRDWKFRLYYEHYFDDHSQMLLEYGRWKDGHIGLEIDLPKNRWVTTVVLEGLTTKDQSGPILYDAFVGHFIDFQISGRDDYYNHTQYFQGWQHWGMGMGNPLLPGPIYNKNGSLSFASNRVQSYHLGITGDPSDEWRYRILLTYSRHWGTHNVPLDEIGKQFNSLYEATYSPKKLKGWSVTAALGLDLGDYPGNQAGGLLTIRKEGLLLK